MRIILFIMINVLTYCTSNCYAQKLKTKNIENNIFKYITEKNNIRLIGGFATTIIRFDCHTLRSRGIELYGGVAIRNPIFYKNSLETGLVYSYVHTPYFKRCHFIEIPLKYIYTIVPKIRVYTGITPSILYNAHVETSINGYELQLFGLYGMLGVEYYFSRKWFSEISYSTGFISQFEDFAHNQGKAIRDYVRLGFGYVL